MKNILVFLMLIIALLSCNNKQKMNFGINESYNLGANEKEIAVTKQIFDDYERIYSLDSVQMPLNKAVKSPDYVLYISMLVENDYIKVNEILESDTLATNIDKKCETDFCKIFFKKNDSMMFGFRYIYKKQNSVYPINLTYFGKDSLTIYNLFKNVDFINEKIN